METAVKLFYIAATAIGVFAVTFTIFYVLFGQTLAFVVAGIATVVGTLAGIGTAFDEQP